MNTPSYVVIERKIIENYDSMRQRMIPCTIAYSMKANPSAKVAEMLAGTDAYFEISSIEEALILQQLDVPMQRVYCGLVVMTEAQISEMNRIGCSAFTYDTGEQLRRIQKCCPLTTKKILRLRVNDLIEDSIGFGMTMNQVQQEPEYLKLADGLSFHISDHSDMKMTLKAVQRLVELMESNRDIKLLNIGGSYALTGDEEEYKTLSALLMKVQHTYNVEIICEPGSAIVDTAVYALTKCIMLYQQKGFTDVFLDGGIPSGMTRKPSGIINLTTQNETGRQLYRFFDTTSMKKLLFQSWQRFTIQEGDILCLKDYGAYSYCYSNIFHSRPLPNVYSTKEVKSLESLV